MGTFLSDTDDYTEYLSEQVDDGEEEYPKGYPVDDWEAQREYVTELQEKILKGEVDKPEWMKNAEGGTNYNDYESGTSLFIIAKDEKYSSLIEKMLGFLNFPSHESCYNG